MVGMMLHDTYRDPLYDNEEDFCPLCCEELDITDKNFKPCPCGYQICQFCYNNIRTNPELNGKCPACRRLYDDESVEYIKMTPEELKQYHARQERKKKEKKELEKQRRDAEQAKRHHLSNMRVIQKNLVYVLGLNPNVPYEELPQVLRSEKYFGQFGKINKVVINRRAATGPGIHSSSGYSVYVTFAKKEDASKCIEVLDGAVLDDRVLKAAHGTTKYCSAYLRGQQCQNPNCMFLHEPGEEADSYNKQESRSTPTPTPSGPSRTNAFNFPSEEISLSKAGSPLVTSTQLHTGASPSGGAILNHEEYAALPSTVSWATSSSNLVNANDNNNNINDNLNINNTTINSNSDSPAFPTLSGFLQEQQSSQANSLQTSPQQQAAQLQSIFRNKQATTPVLAKKKDKKDKDLDKKQVMLDDSMSSFKNLSDNLKLLNSSEDTTGYSINPRYKMNKQYKLFHHCKLDAFTQSNSADTFNSEEAKMKIFKLVDSLLYTPSSKNYNYRSCLEARQSAQVQAQALAQLQAAAAAAAASDISASSKPGDGVSPNPLQAHLLNGGANAGVPNGGGVDGRPGMLMQPSANVQQPGVNTASFLQQRLQQQQMKAMAAASSQGVAMPPGLSAGGPMEPNKANTQELLSQLLK